jgi:hypothetical protein
LFPQHLAEPGQAAEEQPDDGPDGAPHLRGHVGHWEALQMVQLDDVPLVRRKPGQRGGEP